jgi:hypothetical protein
MRWGLIIAMLAVIVLAACKPVVIEDVPVTPSEQAIPAPQPAANPNILVEHPPEENVTAPAVVQPPVIQPVEENETEKSFYERQPEAPPSIAKYQVIFRKEAKNYKFNYKTDQWFVEGKRAKIIPFRVLENIYHAPFIDTIYLDLENRTAVGVCEGRDDNIKRQCIQQNVLGKKFAMPYVQVKIPLPEDWLVEYQNLFMTVANAPKLATDRTTVHLKHISQTRTVDVYIDPSFGLPVAVVDNGIEYHYERLSRNSLGFNEKMVPE